MFRSKRTSLVKRLWKLRLTRNETSGENENSNDEEENETKSVIQSMLKRLKEKQLETLATSVESKGGERTDCVLLPKGDIRLGKRVVCPLRLCLQIWRWPNMVDLPLKRLVCCSSDDCDPSYICCNPHHWSLVAPDTENHLDIDHSIVDPIKLDRIGLVETPVSTETGMGPLTGLQSYTDTEGGTGSHRWCNIAYWEHRDRVGRLLSLNQPNVDIFQELPHGDGMCLGVLQQPSDDEHVIRTREKIGFGITLSKEAGCVWTYNRSNYPIFVSSATLDVLNSRTSLVHKVLPGYSIKVYDYEKAELMSELRSSDIHDGPYDPTSVQISFAKGWGARYSRQCITSCPCRIEVLLNVKR